MTNRFPSDTADKFMARLPTGMRDRLAEAAKTNNRSMNAEVVARLQASFDQSPTIIDTIRASAPDVLKMLDEIASKVAKLRDDTKDED